MASGWRDELKESCKEVIRRKGLEKVTIEELVAEITPKGRGNKAEWLTNCLIETDPCTLHSDNTRGYQGGFTEENSAVPAVFVKSRL